LLPHHLIRLKLSPKIILNKTPDFCQNLISDKYFKRYLRSIYLFWYFGIDTHTLGLKPLTGYWVGGFPNISAQKVTFLDPVPRSVDTVNSQTSLNPPSHGDGNPLTFNYAEGHRAIWNNDKKPNSDLNLMSSSHIFCNSSLKPDYVVRQQTFNELCFFNR